MTWPWAEGEAWRVSGTHDGPYDEGTWSALDMLDGKGRCNWIRNRNCTEETPLVYSMFAGTVSFVTKCKLSIVHKSGWAIDFQGSF